MASPFQEVPDTKKKKLNPPEPTKRRNQPEQRNKSGSRTSAGSRSIAGKKQETNFDIYLNQKLKKDSKPEV